MRTDSTVQVESTRRRAPALGLVLSAIVFAGCGAHDGGSKGVGWGGGVQVTARPGTIDAARVTRATLCVGAVCADTPAEGVPARAENPPPLPFTFSPGQVQGSNGEPLVGKDLKIRVTLYAADGAEVAAASTTATAEWIDPNGWYCAEGPYRVERDRGPVVAVEFRSSTAMGAFRAPSPKPC